MQGRDAKRMVKAGHRVFPAGNRDQFDHRVRGKVTGGLIKNRVIHRLRRPGEGLGQAKCVLFPFGKERTFIVCVQRQDFGVVDSGGAAPGSVEIRSEFASNRERHPPVDEMTKPRLNQPGGVNRIGQGHPCFGDAGSSGTDFGSFQRLSKPGKLFLHFCGHDRFRLFGAESCHSGHMIHL